MEPIIKNDEIQEAIIGNTKIFVVKGDITDQRVDVIVNSANTRMSIGGRKSVAGAIIDKTDGKVLDALSKVESPVDLGNIVVTEGFNLPCRYIFHLATHGSLKEERAISGDDIVVRLTVISKGISNIINKADELKVSSLAMPVFATGSLGYSVRIVIETIINALQENLERGSSLKEIRIMVFRKEANLHEIESAIRSKLIYPKTIDSLMNQRGFLKEREINNNVVKESYFVTRILNSEVNEPDNNQIIVSRESIRNLEAEIFNLRERVRILREENDKLTKEPIGLVKLPLPVAFAVSMVEAENSSPLRGENLRRAFSILLRYFAVIGMAEYSMAGAFSEEINGSLIRMFQNPLTEGAWLKITRDIAKAFLSDHSLMVVKEYGSLMAKDGNKASILFGLLQGLLKLRNEIHEPSAVDDTSTKKWVEKAEPLWKRILKEAKLLLEYQLVFVEDLLDFGESDPLKNQYQIRWLMGEFFVPRAEIVEWEPRLKKGRLFLKHPDSENFLPLYPFMIYEHCQITKAREASYIEKVLEDSISFSTFRFPYIWKDNAFLKEIGKIFRLINNTDK